MNVTRQPDSSDLVADVQQLFAFPFMVNALEAGTIVAVLAAIVGWYMVLRRQSFAGHTLSVMAFPGATGAALVGLPVVAGLLPRVRRGRDGDGPDHAGLRRAGSAPRRR